MDLSSCMLGVDHLGIPAVDVDAAAAFYQDKLGFRLIHRKLVMDTLGRALEAAFLKLGDMVLEIFKPAGAETEIGARGDGILDHFAIDAPDFENCVNTAYRKGLVLHASTAAGAVDYEHVGNAGVLGVNFVGPNGEVVELCHDKSVDYRGRTGLLGWSHLALKVRDLGRSISFYKQFGFEKYADGYLDTPQGRLIIGFVRLHGFSMEIIQVTPAMLPELESRGAGHIDHVALGVKRAEDAFAACRERDMQFVTPVIKELSLFERGVKYFMVSGPDGECIECSQRL